MFISEKITKFLKNHKIFEKIIIFLKTLTRPAGRGGGGVGDPQNLENVFFTLFGLNCKPEFPISKLELPSRNTRAYFDSNLGIGNAGLSAFGPDGHCGQNHRFFKI